jgi:hypothetical protein
MHLHSSRFENQRTAARHGAGCCKGGFRVGDLAITPLAAELFGCFKYVVQPLNVGFGQKSAGGIQWQFANSTDCAPGDKGTAIAFHA